MVNGGSFEVVRDHVKLLTYNPDGDRWIYLGGAMCYPVAGVVVMDGEVCYQTGRIALADPPTPEMLSRDGGYVFVGFPDGAAPRWERRGNLSMIGG